MHVAHPSSTPRRGGAGLAWLGLILILGLAFVAVSAALAQPAGRALVWQVGGSPGRPEGLGTLFWHGSAGGAPANLSDVPDEGRGTRVFACGMDALSPDGSYLMVYIGAQPTGGLYRVALNDSGTLERWGSAHALTCNGRGHARFSEDGSRWVYLDFEADATNSTFPDGTLRLLNTSDGSEEYSQDNVIAFDLQSEDVAFVQFFTDNSGLADELVVNVWDGDLLQERAAITTDDGCDWRSARVAARPGNDDLVISAGQRCTGGSLWRLFTVSGAGEVTERVITPAGGAYFSSTFTNQVYYLDGGEKLLATFPNGRANNVANLVLVTPETNSATLLDELVVTDAYPDGRAEHLLFSPDRSAVAYRTDDNNGAQTLHLLALDGVSEPSDIPGGPPGDGFAAFFFTPDSRQMVYVAGTLNGDNAVYTLNVGESEPRRVARGRFVAGGGLAGEDAALLLENVPPDDDFREDATNLVAVALDNGAKTVIVDGRQAGAWAYPLAWR